jgi:hypothetical protein
MAKRNKKVARQAREARNDGRDEKGRYTSGHSGNPNGRPPKEPEEPKLLDELIAVNLLRKVPVTGADGKTRKVSAYERIVEDLVESIATAKPKERLQILEGLEKRGLFHKMKIMADDDCPNPFDQEHDTWLEDQLRMAEMQSTSRRARAAAKKGPDDGRDSDVFGPPLDG